MQSQQANDQKDRKYKTKPKKEPDSRATKALKV